MYLIMGTLFSAGLIASSSAASSVISTLSCNDLNPVVHNAADVEALSGCSIMAGNIAIGSTFSGALSLPGISVIANTLYGESMRELTEITEVSMSDLELIVEGMDLQGLPKLHTLSMPNLRVVGSGSQLRNPSPELTRITYNGERALNISFPELESVSMTWFEGNIGSIDMPKLKFARSMWVHSKAGLDCNALITQLRDVDFRDGGLECKSSIDINEGHALDDTDGGAIQDQSPLSL